MHIVTDEEAAAAVAAAQKQHTAAAPAPPNTHPTTRRMVFLQARTARDVTTPDVTEPDSLGDMGVADEARAVLESMGRDLDELGLSWQHVTMVGVYLADMSDFAAVNSVYSTFLPIRYALHLVFPSHLHLVFPSHLHPVFLFHHSTLFTLSGTVRDRGGRVVDVREHDVHDERDAPLYCTLKFERVRAEHAV